MKHKWTGNLGLKALSLLVSCLIWLVVTNSNDPESTQVYKNVPITITNETAITSANKTYTIEDGVDKISVYVSARKSVQSMLSMASFTVSANMENYNETLGTIPLEVTCSDPRVQQEDIRIIPSTLKISMEDKVEETFGIAVTSSGKTSQGYELGSATILTGDTIKIAGPQSLINIIGKVTVPVDITNMNTNSTSSYAVRIEDKNGSALTDSQMKNLELKDVSGVSLQNDAVDVSIEIWKVYTDIALEANVTGTVAEGYEISSVTVSPKTIGLVAQEDVMEQLGSTLELADGFSVEGLSETREFTVDLNDTLEQYEDIRLEADSASAVTVTVEIGEIGSRTLEIPISDIIMHNTPEDKKLIFSPADYLTISVKAEDESDVDIDPEDIIAEVDLKSCEINGSYTLPVEVALPDGYVLGSDVNIVVNIDDLDNESEAEASTEG